MNEIVAKELIEESAEDAGGAHPMFRNAPRTVEFNKLRKRLIRLTREALEKFGMVRPGERWLVALSGGKDSYGLLAILLDLKWRGSCRWTSWRATSTRASPTSPSTSCRSF